MDQELTNEDIKELQKKQSFLFQALFEDNTVGKFELHKDILNVEIRMDVCDMEICAMPFTTWYENDSPVPVTEKDILAKSIEDGQCSHNSSDKQILECSLAHFAAMFDRYLPVLKCLKANNCDMNHETTIEKVTPLGVAVYHNQIETVKYLLSLKVDPNKGRISPLSTAISYEFEEIFHLLLKADNIDLDWKDKNHNPLLHACFRAHHEYMEPLLKAGAYPDTASPNGNTPLLNAVSMNNVEMVELLIKYGANVNQTNRRGDPPIISAVLRENSNLCRVLLEAGANPNCQTDREGNSLILLSAYDGCLELVKMLMKFGGDARLTNNQGYSPMHISAWNGHLDCINEFIAAGIPHDEQTSDKNTPLSLAAHGGFLNVIELLLPLKCNVNNCDKDSDTALHYASYNGLTKACELLLNYGADPDIQNRVNTTSLWNAVYKSRKDVVRLLLLANVKLEAASRGIDQHAQTDDVVFVYDEPKSPLWVATSKNDAEIALLLVSSGYDVHREGWLVLGDFPIECDQQLRAMLTHYVQTPPRLVAQCRTFFRSYFGRSVIEKVPLLPIPVTLKSYLTLSDLI